MKNYEIQVGNSFLWNGKDILVQRFLGEGMTARVYLVSFEDKQAVLKVLKENSSSAVLASFKAEIENMTLVYNAWEKTYPNEPNIIPKRFGSNTAPENEFILMELIEGTEIDKMVQVIGKPLKENHSLTFAVMVGRLMVLLHTDMNKCYSDMKIGNFWISGDEPPQFKVTDWGVLRSCTEELVQRDLFFASLILFNVATGASLPYSKLQITGQLETAEHFLDLTPGMQTFFRRAFSNNPSRRFQTAKEWLKVVNDLAGLWSQGSTSLLSQAVDDVTNLERLFGEKVESADAARFERLDTLLRIAGLDPGIDFNMLSSISGRYDRIKARFNRLEIGRNQLKGLLFDAAIATFGEVADLFPDLAEAAYRWQWLAKGAQYLNMEFTTNMPLSFEAVEALLEGRPSEADDRFKRIQSQSGRLPEGWNHLALESELLVQTAQAIEQRRLGQMDTAITNLSRIVDLRRGLPNNPPINWVNLYGDPAALLDSARSEKNTVGQAKDLLDYAENLLTQRRWVEAAQVLRSAYDITPELSEITRLWSKAVTDCFKTGSLDNVLSLTGAAIGTRAATPELRQLHITAGWLKTLERHLERGSLDKFVSEFKTVQIALPTEIPDGKPVLERLIRKAAQDMGSDDRFDLLTILYSQVATFSPEYAQVVNEQSRSLRAIRVKSYQSLVDECVRMVTILRQQGDEEHIIQAINRLDQMDRVVHRTPQNGTEAQAFLERWPEDQESFKNLWKRLETERNAVENIKAKKGQSSPGYIENINQRTSILESKLADLKNFDCPLYLDCTIWERRREMLICLDELSSLHPGENYHDELEQILAYFLESGKKEVERLLEIVKTNIDKNQPREALRFLDRLYVFPWEKMPEMDQRRRDYRELAEGSLKIVTTAARLAKSLPQRNDKTTQLVEKGKNV